MKKSELLAKIKLLDLKDKETRNSVVCSLIGHSRIVTMFFGYVSCARCDDQIGDTLGRVFDLANHVIVGHNCGDCKKNYAKLTWQDKLYVKNPLTSD